MHGGREKHEKHTEENRKENSRDLKNKCDIPLFLSACIFCHYAATTLSQNVRGISQLKLAFVIICNHTVQDRYKRQSVRQKHAARKIKTRNQGGEEWEQEEGGIMK